MVWRATTLAVMNDCGAQMGGTDGKRYYTLFVAYFLA